MIFLLTPSPAYSFYALENADNCEWSPKSYHKHKTQESRTLNINQQDEMQSSLSFTL